MFSISNLTEQLKFLQNTDTSVAIIGDLILDEYIIGYPERISREAPVIILEYKNNFYRLGGAANAAMNASSLGAKVSLIGFIGDDKPGKELHQICQDNNINLCAIQRQSEPTTLKTRILATNQGKQQIQSGNLSTQQVLRIDKLSNTIPQPSDIQKLQEVILNIQEEYILISDYMLGVLSPEIIQTLFSLDKKIITDPLCSFSRFRESILITPNLPDTQKELQYNTNPQSLDSIKQTIQLAQKQFLDNNLLLTCGADGMILYTHENHSIYTVPAFNKADVFDVTGAGDTVSASLLIALSNGIDLVTSTCMANLAASIVVRRPGAATTTIEEMISHCSSIGELSIQQYNL